MSVMHAPKASDAHACLRKQARPHAQAGNAPGATPGELRYADSPKRIGMDDAVAALLWRRKRSPPCWAGTSRSTELKAHRRRSGSSPAVAQDATRVRISIATFAVLLRVAGRSAEQARTSRGVVNFWWDDALLLATYALFQCKPLEYFWMGWDGIHQGACINRKAVPLVHALLGRYNATIVSCLRIPSLAKDIENSYSLTWNQTDALMWTMIEMTTGVVCACMPGHGALFSRLIRRTRALFGIATSTAGTRTAGSHSRSKGHSRARSRGGLGGLSGGTRGTGAGSAYMSRGTQSSMAGGGRGRGETVAKTDVTVREGGVGDGHVEPWGSTAAREDVVAAGPASQGGVAGRQVPRRCTAPIDLWQVANLFIIKVLTRILASGGISAENYPQRRKEIPAVEGRCIQETG
ncbi:hypothetical protein GGTG_14221 [Gaeumannomyces tritici R3-111a-1]|uniref:Rhodopsin domain-containing protein n=1 Tax=Gaeumannomyces tritici (strain R3-111a-1) TaxID=644352 RepID=J3PKZ4_GAET3|nr:hypothetical protein GGTG_14221 [Gaeumannomyces tritici R3-111a-1]EJT68200.1 hypothetical protein GGTG_14221 [Gaeumannomyces tritici R3-111a-1]